ncbi:MAG: UbiA family prenyltransferase [Planctomycetota bacterium]
MTGPAGPDGGPLRIRPGAFWAWAELLRAPLLLSPLADVLAGFTLVRATAAAARPAGDPVPEDWLPRPLWLACAAGCCLLAAGMALNALVDRTSDQRNKPLRPLPRGAISPWSVRLAWIALLLVGMGLANEAGRPAGNAAALIALLILAYHGGLKRLRVPGCLALGSARGLDLLLGGGAALAWLGNRPDDLAAILPPLLLTAALYAVYMTGASLHASTDDEQGSAFWSRAGLILCGLALLLQLQPAVVGLLAETGPANLLAFAVPAAALVRLVRALPRLSPPQLTGVLLSGLYLVTAGVCLAAVPEGRELGPELISGLVVLALFGFSRLLLRVLPPS